MLLLLLLLLSVLHVRACVRACVIMRSAGSVRCSGGSQCAEKTAGHVGSNGRAGDRAQVLRGTPCPRGIRKPSGCALMLEYTHVYYIHTYIHT